MRAMRATPGDVAVSGATYFGERAVNEDSWCAAHSLGLAVVADGMGGHQGGEVASALAVLAALEAISAACEVAPPPRVGQAGISLRAELASLVDALASVVPLRPPSPPADVAAWVVEAVRCANERILSAVRARRELTGIGATLALVFAGRGEALLASVGDTRIYRLRDGALAQLSTDHTLQRELETASPPVAYDRAQWDAATFGAILVRAVGMRDPVKTDVRVELLRPGDVFLVCSRGLHRAVAHDHLAAILTEHAAPPHAARALIDAAAAARAEENATACVLRVLP
ncbi:MAG: protein phosphatase 2C domain-containing protein [Polyangiales bacterium]